MSAPATESAKALARSLGLSSDEALFMQTLPDTFLAAIVLGQVNLAALAGEELRNRGLDAATRWVGFDQAPATEGTLDAFAIEEHARIETFRCRWHQAHQLNAGQFPLAMAPGNQGLWVEQLATFDVDDPFDLPTPSNASPSRPATGRRAPRG